MNQAPVGSAPHRCSPGSPTVPVTIADVEENIAALDSLLARVGAIISGARTADAEPTTGQGADGRIAATVNPDGRLAGLSIDASILRSGTDAVAPGIVEAVNAARAAQPERPTSSTALAELRQLQAETLDQAQALNTSMVTSLERLKASW